MIFSGMNTISRSNLEIWEIFWLIFPSETGHGRSSVWSVLFLRSGGAIGREKGGLMKQEYIDPRVAVSPQDAFYAEKESLPLMETAGRICSEFVMCYPPGIPILAPGEEITEDILHYIVYAKEKGCSMTGPEDAAIERLNVLKGV